MAQPHPLVCIYSTLASYSNAQACVYASTLPCCLTPDSQQQTSRHFGRQSFNLSSAGPIAHPLVNDSDTNTRLLTNQPLLDFRISDQSWRCSPRQTGAQLVHALLKCRWLSPSIFGSFLSPDHRFMIQPSESSDLNWGGLKSRTARAEIRSFVCQCVSHSRGESKPALTLHSTYKFPI